MTDRRSFLRGAAALGGGALASATGLGPFADAAEAKRSGSVRPVLRRRAVVPSRQKPPTATDSLRITGAVRLSQPAISPAREKERALPAAPRVGCRPSTRKRLIEAIAGAPGGAAALASASLTPAAGGDTHTFPSGLLRGMMRAGSLAEAYADGITLTAKGCDYVGAVYAGDDPMWYESWSGLLRPSFVESQVCCMSSRGLREPPQPQLLMEIFVRTPGESTRRLTYIFELSVAGLLGRFPGTCSLRTYAERQDILLSPTSDGTKVAMVSLPGRASTDALRFWLETTQGWHQVFFNWLNVVAL